MGRGWLGPDQGATAMKVVRPPTRVKAMWRLDIGSWRQYVFACERSVRDGPAVLPCVGVAACRSGAVSPPRPRLEIPRAEYRVREEKHAQDPGGHGPEPGPALRTSNSAQASHDRWRFVS
jgi:hypothetical protein